MPPPRFTSSNAAVIPNRMPSPSALAGPLWAEDCPNITLPGLTPGVAEPGEGLCAADSVTVADDVITASDTMTASRAKPFTNFGSWR